MIRREPLAPLEVWGGIECSVVRIGNDYHDQFQCSGHDERIEDLDTIAELGIRTIRYPVLWERVCPDGDLSHADWAWSDARMARLRELGMRPIVGLVHHGSGPANTGLTESCFADRLAEFARAVAERYPWVTDWTPINEPLTTARFSGLYGHWYPHGQDEHTFARALLQEIKGTVLAMRAIRESIPGARLVQTEDMGKTWSTPHLAYQAEFDNERRWLSFDLLCGRVSGGHHRMWWHLLWAGVTEEELDWFAQNPCPPDILGINHYVTSERFLDERLERYPPHTHGSNGRDTFADIEAVRVLQSGAAGPKALLREVWERYGLPIAVTEAHLGSTREEQMRWLDEVWKAAGEVRQEAGADVRAVTPWALLGAYDWDSLLTRRAGSYESGVFDMRGACKGACLPRQTALADMIREIAAGRELHHPVLSVPGWWRRPHRLLYPPVVAAQQSSGTTEEDAPEPSRKTAAKQGSKKQVSSVRPLLITGGRGALAQALARACDIRGIAYHLLDRNALDITRSAAIEAAMKRYQPWAVINAAGYTGVNAAAHEPYLCYRENTVGPTRLAVACAAQGVRLVTFSSAMVFDGEKQRPHAYVESDIPNPQTVYGRSKAFMEEYVLHRFPEAMVVRTSAFFGAGCDERNFLTYALRQIALGEAVYASEEEILTPAHVPDLAQAVMDLLLDNAGGIWHLAHPEAVSRAELIRRAAVIAGLENALVLGRAFEEDHPKTLLPPEPLLKWAVLASERTLPLLPSLDNALHRFVQESARQWTVEKDTRPAPPHFHLASAP